MTLVFHAAIPILLIHMQGDDGTALVFGFMFLIMTFAAGVQLRYFKSDTTGEKAYEEFYVSGEKINMDRFCSLGVIEEVVKRPMTEIDAFFTEMENIFAEPDFTKEEVVMAIKRFIPNFEHEEKGKNLDQKM